MIQLALKDVEKSFSIYQILNGASFEVQDQERVGIVGRNGTGKTTLLKMISGMEPSDKGDIFIRKGAKIGYIEQIAEYEESMTVREVLMMAFEKQQELDKAMHLLEDKMAVSSGEELNRQLKKYGELSEQFEKLDGYETEAKLNRVRSGLYMNESFLNKSFMSLSGGEKTTVLLGKMLLEEPDILLLDEPTNHLDMHAMEWLEEYLREYKGAALIVSHDRYFLDQVTTKIVELEKGKASTFYGNYSYYTKEKERLLMAEFEAFEDQQKKIKAMEKAIKRLRIWAAQGDNEDLFKKAACMQKRLDKMEKLERPVMDAPQVALKFSQGERSGKDVIEVKGLCKAFNHKVLFKELDFKLNYKEHIALIGENGCGKSTLLKMILGQEKQDAGEISLGARLKIAYLPQHVQFEDEELTVLETFKQDVVMTETQARHTLAKFLFYGESVFKKVKGLSGGEKSRLLLCKLIQQDINLLILDEPTNHLDIESRENLEEALKNFKGTLLFISHDRYFINRLAERICEVKMHKIINYLGNYDDYKEKVSRQSQKIQGFKDNEMQTQLAPKSEQENIKKKKVSKNLFKLNDLEGQIKELERKQEEIVTEIERASCDYIKCMELEKEKEEIQEQLEEKMTEWLALEEA